MCYLKKTTKKPARNVLSVILIFMITFSMVYSVDFTAFAIEGITLSYAFSGDDADKAGYAEGTLTLSSDTNGTYRLFWADDENELEGYYPITEFNISENTSKSFSFGYHTAIPASATRIIAKSGEETVAEYRIPEGKQLNSASGNLLYTFNSYSDVHIDNEGYYVNANTHWAEALKFAADKSTDFIISSGDMVTNKKGPDGEWNVYQEILAASDYVNPVWEAEGNHDIRYEVESGLRSFIRATGTIGTTEITDENKPYYYITEKTSGDIFIFMALESGANPAKTDEFSQEQIDWLNDLLAEYYGSGVNVYLIEHSPIQGFGAGDRMSNPYYQGGFLNPAYISTLQFKAILQKYPGIIFMSGHTHEDFSLGYNYSNEDGTACSMIHNPAVVGSTMVNLEGIMLDYNDGKGYNSQGYYVEAYENEVVYYGANLSDELIYPEYCYIMEGSRELTPEATNAETENDNNDTTGCTLPGDIETRRVYFANTLRWTNVNCHSYSNTSSSIECKWPGYGAVCRGKDENGNLLYYCDIPAEHTTIIWNNGASQSKTVKIYLNGEENFFTPTSKASSSSVPVNASIWNYSLTGPDEPSENAATPDEPTTLNVSEPDSTPSGETTQPPTDTQPASTENEYTIGDVNTDGSVNIDDVLLIQKYIAEAAVLSDDQKSLADTDFDGRITVKDATKIQRYICEMINSLFSDDNNDNYSEEEENVFEILNAKKALDSYYQFSSYTQYQELKKLYYEHKSEGLAFGKTAVEFEEKLNALQEVVDKIGLLEIYPVGKTYFFENTNDWSNVYAYAWTGEKHNKSWPGIQLKKVGTHNGHDVYILNFTVKSQYRNVIFSAGKSQPKTKDIALQDYQYNCFSLDGTKNSSGNYNVNNFSF